jgi:hypothetical protein
MLKSCVSQLSRQAICAIESTKDEHEGAVAAVKCLCGSPEFANFVQGLTRTDVVGCCADRSEASRFGAQGLDAFRSEKYKEAAKLFTESLRYTDDRTPEGRTRSASLYSSRAECMLQEGRDEQAVSTFAHSSSLMRLWGSFLRHVLVLLHLAELFRKPKTLQTARDTDVHAALGG